MFQTFKSFNTFKLFNEPIRSDGLNYLNRLRAALYTTIVQNFRGSRKFSADLNSNTGIYSRQGAKYAKFGGER